IFTVEDSVLISLRRAIWVPAENGAFGIAKIGMLFVFAPLGTAIALFGAWMIPVTCTIAIISALLFRWLMPLTPGLPREVHPEQEFRSIIFRFAMGDAAGGLFTQAW